MAFGSNSYNDATGDHPLVGGSDAGRLLFIPGGIRIDTAAAVAAGAVQTFLPRASIAPTGTLTLTPDATQPAVWANGRIEAHGTEAELALFDQSVGSALYAWRLYRSSNTFAIHQDAVGVRAVWNNSGTLTLTPDAGANQLESASGQQFKINSYGTGLYVFGGATQTFYVNVQDSIQLGAASVRWLSVWSTTGTIQTSSETRKEAITPLDPAACYQAAKDVRWYDYTYLPAAYSTPEPPSDIAYDAADDNETKITKREKRDEMEARAKSDYAKMLVETTHARHQRGFVFPAGAESRDELGGALPPVPDLFGLSDREHTSPQADLATLGCAMQEIIRRLEALEVPN